MADKIKIDSRTFCDIAGLDARLTAAVKHKYKNKTATEAVWRKLLKEYLK